MKTLEKIAEERAQAPDLVRMMDETSKAIGGPGIVASHAESTCMGCCKPVNPETDFVDALSRSEWRISRLCQACQDVAFAESEE